MPVFGVLLACVAVVCGERCDASSPKTIREKGQSICVCVWRYGQRCVLSFFFARAQTSNAFQREHTPQHALTALIYTIAWF
jgi:hypothetical protein